MKDQQPIPTPMSDAEWEIVSQPNYTGDAAIAMYNKARTLERELVQKEQELTNHRESSKRDGNWMDKWGACKVCDGEIPHGHSDNCEIFKMEMQLLALQSECDKLQQDLCAALSKNRNLVSELATESRERDKLRKALETLHAQFDDLLVVLAPHLTPPIGEALNNIATTLALNHSKSTTQ